MDDQFITNQQYATEDFNAYEFMDGFMEALHQMWSKVDKTR